MTQTARNDPTSQNDQPRSVRRNTGTPTTNHTSREANRKIRAAASTLTARSWESMPRNLALRSASPSSPRMRHSTSASAVATSAMRTQSAAWNPTVVSSRPPAKKPTPLIAFFEPVSSATQR